MFRADELQKIKTTLNDIYKVVLCLLAKNGAKDFGEKGKVDFQLYSLIPNRIITTYFPGTH